MQRILKKAFSKKNLYAVCFLWFCVIDQRVMTAYVNSGLRETFRNSMAIAMAIIVASHYTKEDILKRKKYHILWAVLGGIACIMVFVFGMSRALFLNAWIVLMMAIWLWGFAIIQTLGAIKESGMRVKYNNFFLVCWGVMMFFMCISRNELLWPFGYLVMFGVFYLTNYSRKEVAELMDGASLGVIWAFFSFQIHAFLYRPFDTVRYLGFYTNGNNNALFYIFVLAAVLYRLYLVIHSGGNIWWKMFYYLGVGTVLSFVFMTVGRAAWLVAVILVALFLLYNRRKNKNCSWLKQGIWVTVCFLVTFPICFSLARYVPPLRHHPIWFAEEYASYKVHSWDPWNSPKFTDFDEFIDAALGRVTDTLGDILEASPLLMRVQAQDRNEPVLSDKEGANGYTVRSTIYRYFIGDLNLWGHKEDEIGFRLQKNYWIGHAHNIYLQMGTQFGIPMMIVFSILMIGQLLHFLIAKKELENESNMMAAFWLLVPTVFGVFEFCWGAGSLSITLLFFSMRWVVCKEE